MISKVEFVAKAKLNLHTFDLLNLDWLNLQLLMSFTRAHFNRFHLDSTYAHENGLASSRKTFINALGVYSDLVTPVPIPNTAVKQVCGETTAREALWEDSTMPIYKASGEQFSGALPFLVLDYTKLIVELAAFEKMP